MLRTIFMIGLFAFLGLFALKVIFGILPWFFALIWWVLGLALKVAILGAVIYLAVRIFSPDTARKWRTKFSSM